MMKFLVRIEVNLPPELDCQDRAQLLAAEAMRGKELLAKGMIFGIWRIPGRLANAGIWEATDATELHEAISSLPVFPYAEVDVIALAKHPLGGEE